jgi:lysophospholipase L1-like esterase
MRKGLLLLGLLLLGIGSACAPVEEEKEHWVGTWAAAPQPALPGDPVILRDQQLRLIVHTSIGGGKVRIRLSNEFGSRALGIGAARIARRAAGAEIDSSSERELRFVGRKTTSIAPGNSVLSDAVEFHAPAFSDLAITLYLSGHAEVSTHHLLAQQTSYVSAPGVTSDARFVAAKNIDSWPFLTGVDVVAAKDAAAVVVFGDSTVDGDGSTADANRRWPDYLASHLSRDHGATEYGVLNLGLIGNRLLRDSPGAGSEFGEALGRAGTARFERDALSQAGVRFVVVRIGINDLGFPGAFSAADEAVSAESLIRGYETLAKLAHARDVRIIATTITPFEGTTIVDGFYSPAKDTTRQRVNAWLRSTHVFDGVVDLDAALRDPAWPSRLLAELDSGDHLHSGDAGNQRAAAAVPRDLLRIDVAR